MKKRAIPIAAALLLCIALLIPQIYTAAKTGSFPLQKETINKAPEQEAVSQLILTPEETTETETTATLPVSEETQPTEPLPPETEAPAEETSETETRSALMEFLDDPASHITYDEAPDKVQALWEQIRAGNDPFSTADPYMGVLLDHESAVKYGDTVENNGLTFTFVEIVNGKAIVSERIEGSLTEGYMTMQDTIEEKTFAVIEVRRTDGAPLTEEDNGWFFRYHRLVSGYNPWHICMCLETEAYLVNLSYRDEYCAYLLADISDMQIFAHRTLALAVTDYTVTLESDVFKADKEGNFAFRENKPASPHALFYFDLPDALADPAAAEEYVNSHGVSTDLSRYR